MSIETRPGFESGSLEEVPADPLENIARQLLLQIGENPGREGLLETPRRYARWWREFTQYDPGTIETVFESVSGSQTVIVSDMQVWSLCEHHLLPFNCSVTVAYRARNNILGLSKFARSAHKHAHKLQLQERLIADIADEIEKVTDSPDVAVLGHGEHLCMTMRGIRTSSLMTSSELRGVFAQEGPERSELLALLHGAKR
ncbi:GTP cyclohydrolase I [Nocardia brasiliensis]|uniref:GTP cyclohydrolase I n=1 Tax=Nocardia brasiliensis TaxID=37326 RepID=UPI00366E3208